MRRRLTKKVTLTIPPGLSLVGPTTWSAIWRRWSWEEGRLKKWRNHFQRQGFRSWSEWRQAVVVTPFGLPRRRWTLYKVVDPGVIAKWLGGPFPRWVAGPYRGAQSRSFNWLAAHGQTTEEKKKIIKKNLPKTIYFFGLIYQGQIVVLDGMHRSLAIAARVKAGLPVKSKIVIALASTKKLPKLNTSLK